MLWSQIKRTPYDSSDLQNHRRIWYAPGHRTIFKNFQLRGHISYGRRSASVYDNIGQCRTVPGRRCRRSARPRTEPGRLKTINFTCNNLYINIKIYHHSFKEKVVERGKFKADFDSDESRKHTCSRQQKIQEHLFVVCYSCSATQGEFIYVCIYIFGLRKWCMYVDAICSSANNEIILYKKLTLYT